MPSIAKSGEIKILEKWRKGKQFNKTSFCKFLHQQQKPTIDVPNKCQK